MTRLPDDDSELQPDLPRDSPGGTEMRADKSAEADEETPQPESHGGLGLLLDMEMPLVVRFGSTRLPLRDLLELTTGSVIDLDPTPEDSVDLLVNGKLVARGVAVSVRGNYGVRISEMAASGEGFASGLAPGNPLLPGRRAD